MKFLIHWLLVVFTVLNPMFANAALTDYDRQEFGFFNALKDKNAGFESGKANWTASGGSFTTGTSPIIEGKTYGIFDASSASQTLTSTAVTLHRTGTCEVSGFFRVPSGTSTYLLQAYDGTNVLASETITNSTTAREHITEYPCQTSGTVAARVVSVASDEPAIEHDSFKIGVARGVGSTQLITEWESWTPTGVWVSNATYTGFKRRVGTNQEIKFRISLGGAPSGTLALNLPAECIVDTTKVTGNNARNALGNTLIFDSDTGANIYGTVQAASTSSVSLNVILTGNASTAPISNTTATVPITFASGDTIDGYFSVPCLGWASQSFVMPNAQGWYVDALIGGGNPSLGTTDVSSYTEMTNASLTMTPRTGSAAVGIMCSSSNAAATPSTSATTCSAGSESVGANFVLPSSGAYEVCAYFSHFAQVDQNEGISTTFQLIETPTNAQTLTLEGGNRSTGGVNSLTIATGTTASQTTPNANCSVFNWSVGTKGVRLMYEQGVAGTPNNSLVLADENASLGGRNIRVTVKPWTGLTNAILALSVSTDNANGERAERARIASGCGSVTSQSGSWISSTSSPGTGQCTVNFTAGKFSSAPICVCNTIGQRTCRSNSAATTSTVTFDMYDGSATPALVNTAIDVICMGAR